MLQQNRIEMVTMNAEVAEKLKHFNFSGLLLRDRTTKNSIVHAFGSSLCTQTEQAQAECGNSLFHTLLHQ